MNDAVESTTDLPPQLWAPTHEASSNTALARFQRAAESLAGRRFADYDDLHKWSIDEPAAFWGLVWDHCDVRASRPAETVYLAGTEMHDAKWFVGAKLNFAENLLRRRDQGTALYFRGEDRVESELTFEQLHRLVSRTQQLLQQWGVKEGDVVAAVLPNMPEAVAAMLACASIGAIWTACAPDFGVEAIVDRFSQCEPKVLFCADGYFYRDKTIDCLEKIEAVAEQLPSVARVAVCGYVQDQPLLPRGFRHAVLFGGALASFQPRALDFHQLSFDHPLLIVYTSGTSGPPKCLVHSAGGVLLQLLKEHRLHIGTTEKDTVFYYSTVGWMMWNWLLGALACEATVVLYDGSPLQPNRNALFHLVDAFGITIFGTSPRFLQHLRKHGGRPVRDCSLDTLRVVLSTGSVLSPAGFDFVYREIKPDIRLSSISGGTEIMGCFACGNPRLPVHRGELQCLALGMAVEVWSDDGVVPNGERGELVCTQAFPSMPLGFYGDDDKRAFKQAYFERFPGVWHHGDYISRSATGGVVFHGRSDATLNIAGVRIGTSEIYRVVNTLDAVLDSVAIAQRWENDARMVLFVRLRGDRALDDDLRGVIRDALRTRASPRHVPAVIVQVSAFPHTRAGKLAERFVRDVVNGDPSPPVEQLKNPECLGEFQGRIELLR
ncbi:MAG: acetoacetate--CoA ligase [Pseudomonadota bacterium]